MQISSYRFHQKQQASRCAVCEKSAVNNGTLERGYRCWIRLSSTAHDLELNFHKREIVRISARNHFRAEYRRTTNKQHMRNVSAAQSFHIITNNNKMSPH